MKAAIGIVRPFKIVTGSCSNQHQYHRRPYVSTSYSTNNKLRITNSFKTLAPRTSQYYSKSSQAKKLNDKWMECQGIKNWEGLLDPLDDDLRNEILRYGEFVETAYSCFDFDTSSSTYGASLYSENTMLSECGLGTSGYKVTKSLHATCSVKMPRWCMERIPPTWGTCQSSWIGFVAVCDDEEEIARLGRRDVVISYRGTATCLEWIENLRATLTCLPDDDDDDVAKKDSREPILVQSGFLSMYTSGGTESLRDTVREEIKKILKTYNNEPLSITITGHSLGAALATLTAYDITNKLLFTGGAGNAPLVTVVSFGGPRVGNKAFRRQLEKTGTKVLRIVNSDDPITKLPGFFFIHDEEDEKDDDVMQKREGRALPVSMPVAGWLQKRVEETQWVYAEVGKELRVSSKDCPNMDKGDVGTCHDLKTYLHLVNHFVSSSTCPLRATANRVLSCRTKNKNKNNQQQRLLFRTIKLVSQTCTVMAGEYLLFLLIS